MMSRTALFVAAVMAGTSVAVADDIQVKVTSFAKQTASGTPGREVTLQTLELPPGASTDLQTHPGDDVGAVIEGSVMVGQGDETMKEVKAGSTFSAAPNTPIRISNTSKSLAKVVTVWILDGSKPPTTVLPPGK